LTKEVTMGRSVALPGSRKCAFGTSTNFLYLSNEEQHNYFCQAQTSRQFSLSSNLHINIFASLNFKFLGMKFSKHFSSPMSVTCPAYFKFYPTVINFYAQCTVIK